MCRELPTSRKNKPDGSQRHQAKRWPLSSKIIIRKDKRKERDRSRKRETDRQREKESGRHRHADIQERKRQVDT